MTVEALRSAIEERVAELLPSLLIEQATAAHKRNWRECPCSWCSLKRRATYEIADTQGPRESGFSRSYPPPPVHAGMQFYMPTREDRREEKRRRFRSELSYLEEV